MKKVLSALLSSAIIVSNVSALPLNTNAAWKGQYEFEKGKIVNSGENGAEITSVNGASGGKAVDIKDGGNTVSLTVNAENSGAHRLSIRYNASKSLNGVASTRKIKRIASVNTSTMIKPKGNDNMINFTKSIGV